MTIFLQPIFALLSLSLTTLKENNPIIIQHSIAVSKILININYLQREHGLGKVGYFTLHSYLKHIHLYQLLSSFAEHGLLIAGHVNCKLFLNG